VAKRVGVDKWLFFTTLSLVVVGLAMVFSASAVMAQARFGSPYTFLGRQAMWALLGVIAMVFLMRFDYRKYNSRKFVYPAMGLTFLLLVAVFVVPGSHATHRWIRFGPFFTFQPSEIAKPILAIYLAWFLHSRLTTMRDWKHTLLPAVAPALLFLALILKEPDLGTAIVIFGMTVTSSASSPSPLPWSPPCWSSFPGDWRACESSCILKPTRRAPVSTSINP
jgi:cell division protein FtsW